MRDGENFTFFLVKLLKLGNKEHDVEIALFVKMLL